MVEQARPEFSLSFSKRVRKFEEKLNLCSKSSMLIFCWSKVGKEEERGVKVFLTMAKFASNSTMGGAHKTLGPKRSVYKLFAH